MSRSKKSLSALKFSTITISIHSLPFYFNSCQLLGLVNIRFFLPVSSCSNFVGKINRSGKCSKLKVLSYCVYGHVEFRTQNFHPSSFDSWHDDHDCWTKRSFRLLFHVSLSLALFVILSSYVVLRKKLLLLPQACNFITFQEINTCHETTMRNYHDEERLKFPPNYSESSFIYISSNTYTQHCHFIYIYISNTFLFLVNTHLHVQSIHVWNMMFQFKPTQLNS